MWRAGPTFSSTLGRLRAPLLALLAGWGFVVHGPPVPVPNATVAASLSVADAAGDLALHPSSGLSTLLWIDGESRRRGRGHGPDSAGGGAAGHGRTGHPAAPLDTRAPDSRAAVASAVFARDALGRSGRLSAPTTAPPRSPF